MQGFVLPGLARSVIFLELLRALRLAGQRALSLCQQALSEGLRSRSRQTLVLVRSQSPFYPGRAAPPTLRQWTVDSPSYQPREKGTGRRG